MSIGICLIAFGEEHVNECKSIINKFDSNLYILTDDETFITDNVMVDKTTFNFNKKRIPIFEAFKKHNITICFDTDIDLKTNINPDLFENIEDGLYVKWLGNVQFIRGQKISINQILKGNSPFDDLNQYGESLVRCGANESNVCFFDEYVFVLKISNEETKKEFITNWESIYNSTLYSQPKDRHGYNLNGSLESLIISLACNLSKIKLYFNELQPFFNSVVHYDSVQHSKTLL
jgi:hypothetical protein